LRPWRTGLGVVSGRKAVVPARLPEATILALARIQEVGRPGPARRRPGDGEECCGDSACDSMEGIVDVLGGDSGFRAPTGLESTEGPEAAGIAGSKPLRRFGVIEVLLWRDARRSGMLDDLGESTIDGKSPLACRVKPCPQVEALRPAPEEPCPLVKALRVAPAEEPRLELGCVPPRLLDSGPWHAGWLHDGDSHGGPPIGYHCLWAHGSLSRLSRAPLTEACIILSLPCVKPR
jgi:hypothetical protein